MAKKKKPKSQADVSTGVIAVNKRARFDYQIEETLEAGLSLMGWEVKSIRAGRVQMNESYVFLRGGEAWLIGCQITPMHSASTHVDTDPMRARKLLLHRRELGKLIGQVERKGFTIVPLKLVWKRGKIKCDIAVAMGKKEHDKRATQKDRDWKRDKARILRHTNR